MKEPPTWWLFFRSASLFPELIRPSTSDPLVPLNLDAFTVSKSTTFVFIFRASSGGFVKISTRSETSNPYLTRVRKRRAGHPSVGAVNRSLEVPSRDDFNGGNRVVPNRGADLVHRRLVHVPGLVIDPVFNPPENFTVI
jgi:hypothetical protein